MTFEEVAAIPQAAEIALQGIREKGQVQPGQQVLINGAGGGAGTFAVQLAKLYGAEVTGVDNTGKLDASRARLAQTMSLITPRKTSRKMGNSMI
jgi:NADPH:quinone reductase-like Zn-dependent oxidoreductase